MFTYIKDKAYIRKKRKELLDAINHWNIAQETTFDEFRTFISEMKGICFMLSEMGGAEKVQKVMQSLSKHTRKKTHDHLTNVLINYYINITNQTKKASDIIQMDKLQVETKQQIKELMEIIHISADVVEDTVDCLQDLIAIE